jgi:membrane protein YdbS with pleckstrin-like domain
MRFEPHDNLSPEEGSFGETLLYRVERSLHPVFLHLAFLTLFILCENLSGYIPANEYSGHLATLILILWGLSLLMSAFSATVYMLNRVFVTTGRIYGHGLFLWCRRFSIPLAEIESVSVSQPGLARPLHYGSLTLHTKKRRVRILWINRPDEVKKSLDRQISEIKQKNMSAD